MLSSGLAYLVHLSLLDIVQVRHKYVKGAFLSINTSAVLGILMPDTVVSTMVSGKSCVGEALRIFVLH